MLFNTVIGLSLLLNQASLVKPDNYIKKESFLASRTSENPGAIDYSSKNILPEKRSNLTSISPSIIDTFVFKKNSDNIHLLPLETITLPLIKKETEKIEIEATSAIAVDLASGKILYEKNPETRLPIASLTKIFSALIAIDNVENLDEAAEVSAFAVNTEGDSGRLIVGEKLSIKDLLYLMLVPSSNDAAVSLAEYVGGIISDDNAGKDANSRIKVFIDLLNNKAKSLLLDNTHFSNPAGIISEDNFSSVRDIVKVIRYLYNDNTEESKAALSGKKLIREILKTGEITVYSKDRKNIHKVRSTNKLLGVLPDIIGGKTGYTQEAGESLVLIVSDPSGRHNIITVVLNASDRFEQSKKLAEWAFNSYVWSN